MAEPVTYREESSQSSRSILHKLSNLISSSMAGKESVQANNAQVHLSFDLIHVVHPQTQWSP
jgi:hypothetical protein